MEYGLEFKNDDGKYGGHLYGNGNARRLSSDRRGSSDGEYVGATRDNANPSSIVSRRNRDDRCGLRLQYICMEYRSRKPIDQYNNWGHLPSDGRRWRVYSSRKLNGDKWLISDTEYIANKCSHMCRFEYRIGSG
jgi:hypothetical protein